MVGEMLITEVLTNCGLAASRKEAQRLIKAGAVYESGERITDVFEEYEDDGLSIIRVGKPHQKRWCYVQDGKRLEPQPDQSRQAVFTCVRPAKFYQTDSPHDSRDWVYMRASK